MGGICLFGENVPSLEPSCATSAPRSTTPPPTPSCRSTRRAATSPGSTTRSAARTPGMRPWAQVDYTALTRAVARDIGSELRDDRGRPRPRTGGRRQLQPAQPGHRGAQLRRGAGPRRAARGRLRRGAAGGRGGRLPQALPGARRHRRRLARRPARGRGPGRGAPGAGAGPLPRRGRRGGRRRDDLPRRRPGPGPGPAGDVQRGGDEAAARARGRRRTGLRGPPGQRRPRHAGRQR